MESNTQGKYEFRHEEILQVWVSNKSKDDGIWNWILEKVNGSNLLEAKEKEIKKKIANFCGYVRKYLPKCNRQISRFKEKHEQWLASKMVLQIEEKDYRSVSASKVGRPQLNYDEAGPRLKRKLAFELSTDQAHNIQLLVHAAAVSAKKCKKSDMAYILKESAASSSKPSEIREKLRYKEPVSLTPEEALTFLLENGLSKQQYINMRLLNKNRHCDIYPTYNAVQEAKLKCRPFGISVSETIAQVSLQNILNHTAQRIILMQEEILNHTANIDKLTLIVSYGFDGTTGQSMYKQRFETDAPESLDQSLFVTTLIPLKLVNSSNRVIWFNETTQSIRFCRPIKIEYIKESKTHILAEKVDLELQIRNLVPLEYDLNDRKIMVNFDPYMTLIDGKVLNIITGTSSSQCCPICGAKPKEFLVTKDFKSIVFKKKSGALQYGVSPLHAWIRFLEFALKIAYRIGINKWQIRDANDKLVVKTQKKKIQKDLWGFDREILKHMHIILIAISCEYPIDAEKFEHFCDKTALLYMEKYPWFPMSATVHKILIHGSDIIRASVVPVGCLGENAAEARNKYYKKDRNGHARKCSREKNMSDVFFRAMDSSDPLVSSLYIKERKNHRTKNKLPAEVLALLKSPEIAITDTERVDEDEDAYANADNGEFADDLEIYNDYSFHLDVDEDAE